MAQPIRIEPHSPSELHLVWDTGEDCVVPYTEIRFDCPCAYCVDEMTGKKVLQRDAIAPDIRPLEVQPVGRYAIQFRWSDGHGTGIYPYDRLMRLCQKYA